MLIKIPTPPDFSFTETVSAHGWRRLLPFEWDEEAQTLSRAEDFGDSRSVQLEIRAAGDAVSVHADTDRDEAALTERVRRMLQLDLPLGDFHAHCRRHDHLRPIADASRGRLLRSPTLWEDAVKAVCKVS